MRASDMGIFRILQSRRFWLFFGLPNLAFAALAAATDAIDILPVMSLITSALSIGICVAFFPAIFSFFARDGAIGTGEALTLGIWCTWFATALLGILTFVWRAAGQPLWLINNDAVAYLRFLNICGACLHLASPDAITDRIPSSRWIKIGAMVAGLVMAFFVASYVLGLLSERSVGG